MYRMCVDSPHALPDDGSVYATRTARRTDSGDSLATAEPDESNHRSHALVTDGGISPNSDESATDTDAAETGADETETREDDASETESTPEAEPTYAIVLDYLPHGHPEDTRPQFEKSPVAQALDEDRFRLFEFTLSTDPDLNITDRIQIEPESDDRINRLRRIEYDDLSSSATAELEYAVEEIIDRNERQFVDFYNDAQPITLRLHQLNLLPGVGKKIRNKILDERKRGPFESFEEITDRVGGLHRPKEVIIDRIMEELRDDDLKYKTFVRHEDDDSR